MNRDAALDRIMRVMDAGFDPHWQEAWTRGQVAGLLALPSTHFIVIDEAGEPIRGEGEPDEEAVGFVLSRCAADEEELLLVAVLPDHRGRGLGAILLNEFERAASQREVTKLFLEMRANNPAENLYRRAGFSPIGTRKGYYRTQNGTLIDAVTFSKHLPR